MIDFAEHEPEQRPLPGSPERHYVYAIVNTDAPVEERIVSMERTRKAARASLDAGEWNHIPGRMRIRRGKLTLFET